MGLFCLLMDRRGYRSQKCIQREGKALLHHAKIKTEAFLKDFWEGEALIPPPLLPFPFLPQPTNPQIALVRRPFHEVIKSEFRNVCVQDCQNKPR